MEKIDIRSALILGDTHADSIFLVAAIEAAKKAECDAIIQVGDFGYWPSDFEHQPFLEIESDIPIYFIDGNHEEHPKLTQNQKINKMTDCIYHIARGCHVKIANTNCLFMGGGYSIDKHMRLEGHSWFKEEAITEEQIYSAMNHDIKTMDVIFSHDCPLSMNINSKPFASCYPDREKLDMLRHRYDPRFWFFGHHHQSYESFNGHLVTIGLDANIKFAVTACTFNFKDVEMWENEIVVEVLTLTDDKLKEYYTKGTVTLPAEH